MCRRAFILIYRICLIAALVISVAVVRPLCVRPTLTLTPEEMGKEVDGQDNVVLTVLPKCSLRLLQLALNMAARVVYNAKRSCRVSLLLQ